MMCAICSAGIEQAQILVLAKGVILCQQCQQSKFLQQLEGVAA